MILLLDTQAFLWMDSNAAKLSVKAKNLITDPRNTLLISAASLWEIQIKLMLGKLSLRLSLPQIVRDQELINQVRIVPVTETHVYAVGQLPDVHRDPFDRLIAATTLVENAALISADPVFREYALQLTW